MVRIESGAFLMGSDRHYPEEAPAHRVSVDSFWIDRFPVTNREFSAFVEETGFRTLAETAPKAADYPGALPHMLKAGSLVFDPPDHPVPLDDISQWWTFRFGANWRRPYGPGTSLKGLGDHPVVHVALQDAEAYAEWAGKALPTEAEWEFASRGHFDDAEYAWGHEFMPDGRQMANTWQGDFPHQNLSPHAYKRTTPVGSYPPNGFGLFDMIGNTWEWTTDWYADGHEPEPSGCCNAGSRDDAREKASHDPTQPQIRIPRKVIKGGSHLCAPSYCRRYRPAARHAQPIDTSTSHVGFRCIVREVSDHG